MTGDVTPIRRPAPPAGGSAGAFDLVWAARQDPASGGWQLTGTLPGLAVPAVVLKLAFRPRSWDPRELVTVLGVMLSDPDLANGVAELMAATHLPPAGPRG